MDRIPCIILCYFDFEGIKKSLQFFSKFKDKLFLIVVENPSKYTEEKIKPFILDLVKKNKIDSYFLMDENIGLNAVEMLLNKNIYNWTSAKYIINAEGDISCKTKTWIKEELNILEKYQNVLACGLGADLESFKKFDSRGAYWYPEPTSDKGEYFEALTGGGHAVMWRVPEMKDFLKYIKNHNYKFLDNYMHPYALMQGKHWARSKKNLIEHFSWNYQLMDNHEYHNIKKTIPWTELFHHDKYCNYKLHILFDGDVAVFDEPAYTGPCII